MGTMVMAHIAIARGDIAEAEALCAESEAAFELIRNPIYRDWLHEAQAAIAVRQGRLDQARDHLVARDALRRRLGLSRQPFHPAEFERVLAMVGGTPGHPAGDTRGHPPRHTSGDTAADDAQDRADEDDHSGSLPDSEPTR